MEVQATYFADLKAETAGPSVLNEFVEVFYFGLCSSEDELSKACILVLENDGLPLPVQQLFLRNDDGDMGKLVVALFLIFFLLNDRGLVEGFSKLLSALSLFITKESL